MGLSESGTIAGLGGAPHMEQWVTTTDELSAGGRYASLTEGAAYRYHPIIFHFK
jgi:hypothetical protein